MGSVIYRFRFANIQHLNIITNISNSIIRIIEWIIINISNTIIRIIRWITWTPSGTYYISVCGNNNKGIHYYSILATISRIKKKQGRDLVGISRTGSGKTLSYLLPLIVHIQAQPVVKKGEGPIGLILAPTRELTSQINEEINKFIESNPSIKLKNCAVYGGSDRHKQIYLLKQSPDILVATPGRLLDLLECGETNFKRTTYCVFDEADRMLDMGFRDDLETILSYIQPDK